MKSCCYFSFRRGDRAGRRGFTLLEVILALAVLAVGLAIIGEANNTADQNARRAAFESEAAIVAESVVTEIAAGARELAPADNVPWDDGAGDPRWSFRITIEPTAQQGLLAARVTAFETRPFGQAPVSVTLSRWVVDPAVLPAETASGGGGTSSSHGGVP